MTSSTALPYFARDREFLKIFSLELPKEGRILPVWKEDLSLPTPKAAAWSPDGLALALVDPSRGLVVLELSGEAKETAVHSLGDSLKSTQSISWSPRGSHLVAMSPAPKGSQEPNVHIWSRAGENGDNGGEYTCAASYLYSKLEKDKKLFQWTSDEALCARLCPDGAVHVLDGSDLASLPLVELSMPHPAVAFEFAPARPRVGGQAVIAVFVPDVRDDMQRVIGPAEVSVFELGAPGPGQPLRAQKRTSAPVVMGQHADIKWNANGTVLLAHCQTEVDESGVSYYGASRLVIVCCTGRRYQKDLTETSSDGLGNGDATVQAVDWSPARDEFVLIRGFQPAQAALWSWDEQAQKVSLAKVLLEKAHRNTIRFNHFGSLVCLAGFGNLAGEIDFFGRVDDERCDYVRVSSCQANCTVSAEWSPDGRHFLTAVLAPRMRVDNCISVWEAISGAKVHNSAFEELYDAQWRPEPPDSVGFSDVSLEEVEKASKELASRNDAQGPEQKKKQAYRPPKARGEGGGSTVAAMMRGEAPDLGAPAHDRARKSRAQPPPPRRGEEDAQASPYIGPSAPPEAHPPPSAEPVPPRPKAATAERPGACDASRPTSQSPALGPLAAREAAAATSGTADHRAAGYPSVARPVHMQQDGQATAAQRATPAAQQGAQQGQGQGPGRPAASAALQQHQQVPAAERRMKAHTAAGHGEKLPCPADGWQYVDPKKNIRGPFTLLEMQQWNSMGYFRAELPMRCDPSDPFLSFSELFPHPLIPFQSYPKRPAHVK